MASPGLSGDDSNQAPPWYRKRAMFIAWVSAVLILLALIVFGITQLAQGPTPSPVPRPSTTPTSTKSTTTTATTTTTTTTTTTPTSTSTPSTEPTQSPPHRPHWPPHLPQLPGTITLPGTVVTVPPGR